MARKPIGQRGRWFAKLDGEELPCVRKHWWIPGQPPRYHDPYGRPDGGRWDEIAAALVSTGRAILTSDNEVQPDPVIRFNRRGYVAVFRASNVTLDQNGLRFNFEERLESFT